MVMSGGIPSWVKPGASIDMDFANGRYFGCTLTSCLSITRASQKTNLLPSSASGFTYTTFANNTLAITSGLGILIEEARTNLLLNSATPATQTTGSLGTATYTLWVNGSGSATMSAGTATGCGTGTATNGSSFSFTITIAGTCTVTVTGSLNFFQLESSNFGQGTSGIVTAGTTVTRAADIITPIGPLLSLLKASQGTIFTQTSGLSQPTANNPRVIGTVSSGNGGFMSYINYQSTLKVASFTGSTANVLLSTTNSVTPSSVVKAGFAWISAGGRTIAANGVTAATDAQAFGTSTANPQIGGGDGSATEFIDGYLGRLTGATTALSAAQVASGTQ